MIDVKNLRKEFKKNVKEPGLRGSIKALFRPKTERVVAVDDISFHVPEGEILGFIAPGDTPEVPEDPCRHWRGILRFRH